MEDVEAQIEQLRAELAAAGADDDDRGALVNLQGDYFGPVVNLAARLVAEAVPGEILAPAEGVDDEDVVFEPAERRNLRGFDDPIEVVSLRSAATPER